MAAREENIFERDLGRNPANHQPLTPLTFLDWAAAVYPDKTAVVHGDTRYSYREFYERCRRLASSLSSRGVGVGDTVAVMAPNVPALLEAHYGVPMTGGVLNAINIRQDAETVAFILEHGEAKALITDRESSPVVEEALSRVERDILIVDIDDPLGEGGDLLGELDYEALLSEGDPDFEWRLPEDEWEALALNYTSGTTGNPKGVVYHHRGAFLNAIGNVMAFGLNKEAVYLWTLPMFHCNGWTYTWAVTAAAGTHVCLRRPEPSAIFEMARKHGVTHMCAAPIVLNTLVHAPEEAKQTFAHTVEVATGGSAPPSTVIAAMEEMGFRVTHLYGLTETYGPASVCAWQDEWDGLSATDKAMKLSRQGVPVSGPLGPESRRLADGAPGPGGRGHDRRGDGTGQHRDEGLPEESHGHGGGVRRRLAAYRRPRGDAPGWIYRDQGPVEGHHNLGRREYLEPGGRGGAIPAPPGDGGRSGGQARRDLGGVRLRVRHPNT